VKSKVYNVARGRETHRARRAILPSTYHALVARVERNLYKFLRTLDNQIQFIYLRPIHFIPPVNTLTVSSQHCDKTCRNLASIRSL